MQWGKNKNKYKKTWAKQLTLALHTTLGKFFPLCGCQVSFSIEPQGNMRRGGMDRKQGGQRRA